MITYEWTAEQIDQHGDIQDSDYQDNLKSLDTIARYQFVDIGLVKNTGDEANGITDRTWAYIESETLPTHFMDGSKVPQRFHKEFTK